MNNEVIKTEQWKKAFKLFWNKWQQKKNDFENILKWWDVGKSKIREITQEISLELSRDKAQKEKAINNTINSIHARNPDDPRLEALRSEQKQLYELKASGAKIRSRAKWEEFGEKPTRYFHALEERNYSDRTWDSIKDKDGQVHSGIDDILRIQLEFYEDLYKAREQEPTEEEEKYFLDAIEVKVTEEKKQNMDQDISAEEIQGTKNKLKNNKSPGPDGITAEFYKDKEVWELIKDDFFRNGHFRA